MHAYELCLILCLKKQMCQAMTETSLGDGVVEAGPKEAETPVTVVIEHGETAENPGDERVLVDQQRYQLVFAGTCT